MICERCGHEIDDGDAARTGAKDGTTHWVEGRCIANLRADLVQSRKMELDAETRACAAEERAFRAEKALRRLRGD